MKAFIRRHAAIGYHRNNYKHIVLYTEKLMALNFTNKKSVQTLRNKIQAEAILTEKEWLLEQLMGTK